MNLELRRRFYAEEIEMLANIRTPGLVEALATVPREQYLPPGPWLIRSDADVTSAPRPTRDADPRHVYHNVAIAIDPARQLFNGAPGLLAAAIDALAVRPGDRVFHLGTGLGYYTALLAACAGSGWTCARCGNRRGAGGAVSAEPVVDAPPVEVRHDDGTRAAAEHRWTPCSSTPA